MTAATTTARQTRVPASRPGFGATLASEWTKMTTLRSTYITLAIGIFLSIGMTALISLAVGTTFDEWTPADQASFEPIMFSLAGTLVASIAFAVLGVNATAQEYSSGMIGLTLTATPQRSRVLLAKMLIVAVISLIGGAIAIFGMFLVGQAVLGAYDMPTASLSDSSTLQALITITLGSAFFPVFGTALGVALRSTAGAITAVLALIWAPAMFGGLLPQWWQENIVSLLPGNAIDSLTIPQDLVGGTQYIETTWLAAIVVVAWTVFFIGGALLLLNRRDA